MWHQAQRGDVVRQSKPLGIILAGGLATRMGGGDKGRLRIGGRSLISHVIDRLSPQVERIALNANGDPARFADLALPVIADSIDGFAGPLAGVLAGLDWAAAQGVESIVTVAADTPFFPKDLVQRLKESAAGQQYPLVLATTPKSGEEHLKSGGGGRVNRHPTFGLWPVALRDDLRAALEGGLRKVVLWTDRHGGQEALFEADPFDPFFNVNTPEDLARAEALLR
ncbi:molybdenum cofactor guanylyltransferase MobA [Phaeobacter sp. JH20_13]